MYLLPDFAGVIAASFEQVVDVVIVGFQSLMLRFGAHAKHGDVLHGLS